MKRFFGLSALVALICVGFVACNKVYFEQDNTQVELIGVDIVASLADCSRVELGDDTGATTPIYWSEDDAIVITIEGENYTFTIKDYTPNQQKACFYCEAAPATLAEGSYVATYQAEAAKRQSGEKSDLKYYQPMTAEFTIGSGEGWSDVKLNFCSDVAIVKLTLSHKDFKGQAVSGVVLKNWSNDVVAMAAGATVTGDATTGAVTVYFAVKPQTFSVCTAIEATCGDKRYGTFMYAYPATPVYAKSLEAGKLYRINKALNTRHIIGSGDCHSYGSTKYELYGYSDNIPNDVPTMALVINESYNIEYEYQGIPKTDDYVDGYNSSSNIAPWRKEAIKLFGNHSSIDNLIEYVEIGDGVSIIGENAFTYMWGTAVYIQASNFALNKILLQDGFITESLYINSLKRWCEIDFANEKSSPFYKSGGYLYLNGQKITNLVIPQSVTEIKKYTFMGCKFDSITIHENVQSIGESALANYIDVNIFCKAVNPPAGHNEMFVNGCVKAIYVPEQSVESYKAADGWKEYKDKIVGHQF